MTFPILGDLAQTTLLKRISAQAQIDLSRAGSEIATGRIEDPAPSLGAAMKDFSFLERRLTTISTDIATAREVRMEADVAQAALGKVATSAERLSVSLLGPATLAGPSALALVAEDAVGTLDAITSALNTQYGDRSVFSGTAVKDPAVASSGQMLDAIEAELIASGATTATDLVTVIDAWFAPGGGFDGLGYLGSTTSRQPLQLTESQRTASSPRADDAAIRTTLAEVAKAAILSRDPLGLADEDRVEIAKGAGTGLLGAGTGLAGLRAVIGQTQERAELADVELQTEDSALRKMQVDLVGVDPYRAATDLAAAEARLEKIYTITARLSRLSLSDFLR